MLEGAKLLILYIEHKDVPKHFDTLKIRIVVRRAVGHTVYQKYDRKHENVLETFIV